MLNKVEKPARYVGGEWNAVHKKNAEIHFALCFADVYEVGMSHLGLQILYEVLNDIEGVYAQRAFCPWTDAIAEMKQSGVPLKSLEEGKPLHEFDMVGINLSYEMCYSNVLAMLELGKIERYAKDRTEGDPIIIGGGACTVNPEPIADFFDLFVLGEGEEVVQEICELYQQNKKQGGSRGAFLEAVAGIDGVYVPSFYEISYNDDCTIKDITSIKTAPQKVFKRFVKDFDAARTVRRPVVPFVQTVHDRCVLEVMRGCYRGCRFCQAGYTMRPVRERKAHTVQQTAREVIAKTGYDEISLASLSSGDYSEIDSLVAGLMDEYAAQRVSVSMPSLRIDSFDKDFANQLQQVRKTGLTFAPEAGTQRLRDVINKNLTTEQILSAARRAFFGGVSSVKLYFMIGLPTETYEDLDGIAELVKQIKDCYYEVPKQDRRGFLSITVSASCFVPKACTPFMWEPQDTIAELTKKQQYLKEKLKMKGVKFNYHDADVSFLEAVFARGDRRLSAALADAYDGGAVFDAWHETFRLERYTLAFEKNDIDPSFYANRKRDVHEIMPFGHLDCYISDDFLRREQQKAYDETTTPECREACGGCGLQGKGCEVFERKTI